MPLTPSVSRPMIVPMVSLRFLNSGRAVLNAQKRTTAKMMTLPKMIPASLISR